MRPLAFVDLETTGATATVDRITEIGIIEVDADGAVREWQQLVNPGVRIPPFIEQLTGISNEMVAAAPPFEQVAADTLRRLEGRLFIAHNARFDYSFLKNEFKRLGVTFRAPVLCTVKLSRTLFPEHKRHNLDSLIERHGLAAEARHRALADAQLIHQFWQKIHIERDGASIEAALQAQNARPSLPPQLDPAIVDDLPDGHGVYLFYGENALPLYVGKAKNLRQRVLSHFAADHSSAKEMALAQQVRRIDWIETAGEIGALLKEATLVKTLQPTANRLLRRNDEVCTWTLVDEGEGWLRPQLALASELDFGIRSACYGLFKNSKEASEVLRALAAEHRLCDALLGLEKTTPGKPCFGYQLKRCKGACIGAEPYAKHTMRLIGGLARLKLVSWPVNGPALIREGEEAHLIDGWRYLGTARSDEELQALLTGNRPAFDRDIYKLLAKHVGRLLAVGRTADKRFLTDLNAE
ncbi:MAG: ethanolamine utilization protein [Betaproteobacteria bacterium HGW-Betaproteobacteria-12]|nr:MAG: ethanolamine utilization protein [Betaproteobacteria bacterium HGW-Betaproteobacteria-12]